MASVASSGGAMYVTKRNGKQQPVSFDKITERIAELTSGSAINCGPLSTKVQPVLIAQKVCAGVFPGVTTMELDDLAAETACYMSTDCPEYSNLAARIAISNLHKQTDESFFSVMTAMRNYINPKTNKAAPLICEPAFEFMSEHKEALDAAMKYERDFTYDFFAYKTLERSYLSKLAGHIVERPQHMIMRVACGIHGKGPSGPGNLELVLETYELMSQKWFTHASPTLFNACSPMPQLSSCFLLSMVDDSIEGIYETLKRCALISKTAGGIGLALHNIRAGGTYISGTNGTSNGIVPMLRVYNQTARFVNQGGGKRMGSFAVYIEPWHADIFEFLDLRKNHGKEEARARDLFYGMWTPDLFMKRVEADGEWSLFCPHECPGLGNCWGKEFEELYAKYEASGKARKTIKAQKLWFAILESQVETGTPYMLYKDACNSKSNQQNLGCIKSSNLCTEILEYTDADEVAVCNLASISLKAFAKEEEGATGKEAFDHEKLFEITKIVTRNLNNVIDINYYPVVQARNSNFRHRPIGIGVQGFADLLMQLRLPFESKGAIDLNREIFETIYFAAVTMSCELAQEQGPYETYPGSPMSKGVLQPDMWGVTPTDRWDWAGLRAKVLAHGVRNSLLVAPMPTASTAQILGNNESFEPYTSNLYTRRVLSGEFAVVNKYLLADLDKLGMWPQLKNDLIAANGSVQNLPVPQEIKDLYKTTWEIKQKVLIDMAADRGAFIDQSQSLNVFMQSPNFGKLTSMHFYSWRKGLKTGMYYLRTKSAVDAIKFTVDQKAVGQTTKAPAEQQQSETYARVGDGGEGECISCGA